MQKRAINLFLIVLVCFSILTIFNLTGNDNTRTLEASIWGRLNPTCTKPGGYNIEVQNKIDATQNGRQIFTPTTGWDYCKYGDNTNILIEWYCQGTQYKSVPIDCSQAGKKCISGKCITESISGNSEYSKTSTSGSFNYVCPKPCPYSNEIFLAKFQGLENGFNELYKLTGITPVNSLTPIYYLSNGDGDICIKYGDLKIKTAYSATKNNKGILCLYDYEHGIEYLNNYNYNPFDVQNAVKLRNQMLAIHEMGHVLFFTRTTVHFNVAESFVVAQSFRTVGYKVDPTLSNSQVIIPLTPCDSSLAYLNDMIVDRLAYLLCRDYGLRWDQFDDIYKKVDDKYKSTGIPVDDNQFKLIVDQVLGKDTTGAFTQSGINIVTTIPACSYTTTTCQSWSTCTNNLQRCTVTNCNGLVRSCRSTTSRTRTN
ncbi:MAG: hypothetical protein WC413_04450 [Candidatus Nanoarchaeia archaeon]